MRRPKFFVLQHARLVERFAAQHFMPEPFVQFLWLGGLILKCFQIHHPRQRRRPPAGLIPLVAMQYDAVRFHQAGKKTGRERDAARRDDHRANIIQRQPPFILSVRPAGDESALAAKNRAVLKNMKNVMAHDVYDLRFRRGGSPPKHAGVAQISNLLYRRIAFGGLSEYRTASGLQIRDTAECNSALRSRRDAFPTLQVASACRWFLFGLLPRRAA